ncbi:MAG: hypothetical protein ABJL57_10560 [Hyphomonas sp.]|uniref:hypothetical protein n=1 Tax=Hyphomonas sp. TaxID=87 RepID=UPI003264B9CF
MKRFSLMVVGGMFLAAVAACHTDPFSVKPEVNVTLPETPAEPVDEEPGDTSENPDS